MPKCECGRKLFSSSECGSGICATCRHGEAKRQQQKRDELQAAYDNREVSPGVRALSLAIMGETEAAIEVLKEAER